MDNLLNYHRRKRFINAIVGDAGLDFREDDSIDSGHTEGKTVVMPTYPAGATREQDVSYFAQLIGQCYQNLPDARADVPSRPVETTGVDQIYDCVTQFNVQNKRQGMYAGADEYLHDFNTRQLTNAMQEPLAAPAKAFTAFDGVCKGDVGLVDAGHSESLAASLHGEELELFNKLMDECYMEYVAEKEGGTSLPLANKIARILNTPESQEQQCNVGEGQDDGQSNEGSDKQDGDGEQEGEGQSQGEGQGEEGQEKGADNETAKPLSLGEGYKAGEIGKDKSFTFDYSGGGFKPCNDKVVDCSKSGDGHLTARYKDRIAPLLNNSLSTQVRNLLKIHSQAKYQGGKRRGKLNKRAIATVTRNNEKIFRKKEVANVLDTTVYLLVDSSGSMSGEKYTHAVASAALLAECLQKLNIPVCITGFTTEYCGDGWDDCNNLLYKHKGFYDRVDKHEISGRMTGGEVRLAGNADAEALMYAFDELMQQKQKRKIMIVLSDGQPADGCYEGLDPDKALRKVARSIEATKGVELYGIGILTDCVTKYYRNTKVLHNTNKLEETLLNLIKDSVIN